MLETLIAGALILVVLGVFGTFIGGIIAALAPFIPIGIVVLVILAIISFLGGWKLKKILTAKIVLGVQKVFFWTFRCTKSTFAKNYKSRRYAT